MPKGRDRMTSHVMETQCAGRGRLVCKSIETRRATLARVLRRLPVYTLIAGVLLAPSASAGQEYDWQMDVLVSLLFGDDADDTTMGLRAARRLSERFWLEGRLSHLDAGDLDVWFLDASAKTFLDRRGRSRWYVAAGAGRVFSNLDDIADGPFIFHAGIGSEIGLGERVLLHPTDRNRFYLRPEILVRWGEDSFDNTSGDFGLSFGWRF